MKRIDENLTRDLSKLRSAEYPLGGRRWKPEILRTRRDALLQIAVRAALVDDKESLAIAEGEAVLLTGVADALETRGLQASLDRFWNLHRLTVSPRHAAGVSRDLVDEEV